MTSVLLKELKSSQNQITMSTTYQNHWDTSEAILTASFIAKGAYIKKNYGGISRNGDQSIDGMEGGRTIMEQEGFNGAGKQEGRVEEGVQRGVINAKDL